MATLRKELGERIAELRRGTGLTQGQLAERADIDTGYLARIESGDRGPSIEVLDRIAVSLRVSVAALWTPLKPARPKKGLSREMTKLGAVLADADEEQIKVLTAVAKLVLRSSSRRASRRSTATL